MMWNGNKYVNIIMQDSPGRKESGEGKAELRQKSHISAEQKRRCNIKVNILLNHTENSGKGVGGTEESHQLFDVTT